MTINIDSDYVDAGAAAGGALFPNGSFVQVSGSPYFYEIAGGAPLLVSNWSDVGGAQPYTVITQQQFDALNPVPTDGTLIETNTGGRVPDRRRRAAVRLEPRAVRRPAATARRRVEHRQRREPAVTPECRCPSSGTFLTTTTGPTYRVAGGAPIGIGNWSVFGGVKPAVTIDPWDVENLFNPAAHLLYRPMVGTVVEGLPSGAYWEFGPKNRYLVAAEPGAVRVADHGLMPFSAIPCRVPGLGHMTLAQVKAALLKADCHLGKVHDRPLTRRRHTLRVIKQSPEGAHDSTSPTTRSGSRWAERRAGWALARSTA